MTVTSSNQDVSYSTDGSTTTFPIPFYFLQDGDITVDKIDGNGGLITLVLGSDYTLTGAGLPEGGSLKTLSVIPVGFTLHVSRVVPVTQETVYQQNDAFPAKTTEKALDKLTMIAQQHESAITNSIRFPRNEYGRNGVLPHAAERASKIVSFDDAGNMVLTPMPASVGAGDLKNETWTAGVDYVTGVSNSVPLSRAYGTKANLGTVVMAGIAQDPATYTLVSNNTVMQFNAPIPPGVDRIWCVGGTTLSIYVPPDGSVTDEKIADPGLSASKIGYTAPYDGAMPRPQDRKNSDILSILDFGGKGDGVFDNTTAMNAAHATGKPVYYPTGTYVFTTLSAIFSGGIIGDGRSNTILRSTDTSSKNIIEFVGSASNPIFRDFTLLGAEYESAPIKSAGAGIALNPTSGEIGYANFDNVTIAFVPICVEFVAAAYFKAKGCEFTAWSMAGARVNNTHNPDSGDSSFVGCLFNSPRSVGVGLLYNASGGLKVSACKFLGGANNVLLGLTASADTSDFLLTGCSLEGSAQQNVAFARQSGTANFSNIVISGCQFLVATQGIQTDASGAFSAIGIGGGTVFNLQAGASAAINLTNVMHFSIGDIVIRGNGGTPAGVSIASSCSNGKLGKLVSSGLASPILNGSTSVLFSYDEQQGVAVTSNSGWSAYGSLYIGPPTAVVFAAPYQVPPQPGQITLAPSATNGEIGGIVTSISSTGFTFLPLSSVSGISARIAWKANGIT
ncbi:glycosyl hydrolase family 28-related protein [Burkholderia stagnalis]|uniref:glycosyl hydrolase family 28-related protein n=1 Tax=Burkholderia stagnalis TaxID=1503054 RepID=UPI0009BF2022|nr:glycosyl hydrolase family 28-related protein [Burkholderia stagnalis]